MGDHVHRGRAAADGAGVRGAARLAVLSLLGERAARHGFHDGVARSVAQAAALTGAIQAQDPAASRLGLRVRSAALTEADVLAAISTTRTVVRTWLMRATIHLVDAADVRWMLRLLAPVLERTLATRWEGLGLTAAVRAQVLDALPDVLAGTPLTRAEAQEALAARGVVLDGERAGMHALMYASTVGLVCRGPDRGRIGTFTLLDPWLPDSPDGPSGDDALAELARRYFTAYSPATPADFTAWSGLPSGRAIGLIRDLLTPVPVEGRAGFRLGAVAPASGVRLLPAFDNYLIGYRARDTILAPELRPRIYAGGIIRPAVLRDGQVVGSWRLTGRTVSVERFGRWPSSSLDAEVDDLARFFGRPLSLG